MLTKKKKYLKNKQRNTNTLHTGLSNFSIYNSLIVIIELMISSSLEMNMLSCILHIMGNQGKRDLAAGLRLQANGLLLQIQLSEKMLPFSGLCHRSPQRVFLPPPAYNRAVIINTPCCVSACMFVQLAFAHLDQFWGKGLGNMMATVTPGCQARVGLSTQMAASKHVFCFCPHSHSSDKKMRTIRHTSL